ncbi:MAG: DNA primase [Bdellovibrionales bacterium]|nr:DNA primase [Bdellovibrionales bacterium]
MIEQGSIDEVLERSSLLEVVQEVTSLRQQSGRYVGLCPFHSEKSPSFHVRPDRKMYHCFGCGASGNTIGFVMRHYGMSFPDAVRWLADRFNIELRYAKRGAQQEPKLSHARDLYAVNRMAQKFFSHSLQQAPKAVRDYVSERGISRDAIEQFQIGFAPAGWRALSDILRKNRVPEEVITRSGLGRRSAKGDLYDTFRGRLIFPILSSPKQIIGFGGRLIPGLQDEKSDNAPKYLNSSESEIYQKKRVLFALPQASQRCRETGEVWLVEGYMDVVGLWQTGITNAVATCGTAVTHEHVQRVSRLVQKVNILFDGDLAGRAAAAKLFPLFLNSGLDVKVYFLSSREDPDSVAREHSGETERYLQSLASVTLLDAFIEYASSKLETASDSELGAAAKGKLAEQVLSVIQEVKNPIERDELVRQASLRLRVEAEVLISLESGAKVSASNEESSERRLNSSAISSVESLPHGDQVILRAAMVRRHLVTERILRDSEICSILHSSTLSFLQRFHELLENFRDDADSAKAETRELLRTFGPSWIEHWRSSYAMENETDFELLLEQAVLSLSRARVKMAISERRELLAEASEEEKLQLHQEILELERALRRGTLRNDELPSDSG